MSKVIDIIALFGRLPSTIDTTTPERLKKRAKEVQKRLAKDGQTIKLSRLHLMVANTLGYSSWQALNAGSQNAAVGAKKQPQPVVVSRAVTTQEAPAFVPQRVYAGPFVHNAFEQMELDRIESEEAASEHYIQMEIERREAEEAASEYFFQLEIERRDEEDAANEHFLQMEIERRDAEDAFHEALAQNELERLEAEEEAQDASIQELPDDDVFVYDEEPTFVSHWTDALDPVLADFAHDSCFNSLEEFEDYMDSLDK